MYDFTFLKPSRRLIGPKAVPKIILTSSFILLNSLVTETFSPEFAKVGIANGTQARTVVLCIRPCEEDDPCALPFLLSGKLKRGKLRVGSMLSEQGVRFGKYAKAEASILALSAEEIIIEAKL
jgi:hypothetical protein